LSSCLTSSVLFKIWDAQKYTGIRCFEFIRRHDPQGIEDPVGAIFIESLHAPVIDNSMIPNLDKLMWKNIGKLALCQERFSTAVISLDCSVFDALNPLPPDET